MYTTIQISSELKKMLEKMKLYERETYDDVIERLVEDELELNEETKKEIELALKEVKEGKYVTHEEAKKKLGI
jgi:predicted transcriptional regulator